MQSRLDSMYRAEPQPVVITGMGLWTPLGSDRETTWQALVSGRSASTRLSGPYWIGCDEMVGAPYCPCSPHTPFVRDPLVELALQTARAASDDAEIRWNDVNRERVGVVFGTSKGGLHTVSRLLDPLHSQAAEPDLEWLDVFPDAASRALVSEFDIHGPSMCPVLACATGLAACQRAAELIQEGLCNLVLAGSSDSSLQPAVLGSFRRLGVLGRPLNGDASTACRPFDRDRNGFVIGEGAACLVFESLTHAMARGARWYGEWVVGRMLTDPTGLTQLDPSGESLRRLLSELRRTEPACPDYINLHGTATVPNDRIETLAVREVLGNDAPSTSCSSLKGGLGHLLGAAGSVELAATLLAIRDQLVPPTVNLKSPEADFGLDFTRFNARSRRIDLAWKVSLGFGGHLSAAAIRRLRGDGDRTRAATQFGR